MKLNKFILPLIIFSSFSLTSCKVNVSELDKEISNSLTKKEVNLFNEGTMYELKNNKINAYFFKDNLLPYIGLNEFIHSLDGYFKANEYSFKIDNYHQKAKLIIKINNSEIYFEVDANKDTLTFNNEFIFSNLYETEGISFNTHFKASRILKKERRKTTLDLKPYEFNTLIYEDDILIPLEVLNIVFLNGSTSNLVYNQKDFYFYPTYLNNLDFSYRNKDLIRKKIPKEIIKSRNNSIYFLLDNYYGLKDTLKINSFKSLVNNDASLYNLLNSDDPKSNSLGLVKLFHLTLNDPHTTLSFKNYYEDINEDKDIYYKLDASNYSPRYINILRKLNEYSSLYLETFKEDSSNPFKKFNKTMFIKFNEFNIGTNEELYNEDGSLKEDAYLLDTFYLVKEGLSRAKNDNDIQNIVIDLTTNTGGYIASNISTLGLLTNDDIKFASKDFLTDEESIISYKVDGDNDNDFDDLDAYDEFNYYILTSEVSFSSANTFTSICKDMGIAKIIGEKSGGGMCAVTPTILNDGSYLSISGQEGNVGFKLSENNFETYSIEYGVSLDYNLPSSKFYDLEYIDYLINNKIIN